MTKNIFALALAGALLASCATSDEPPAALSSAQTAFNNAANDPKVSNYASLELKEAQEALNRAEAAWREDADAEEAQHAAYLAEQRALIAREVGRLKAAEAEIESAGELRSEALLAAREAEVESLQQQLEQLRSAQSQKDVVLTMGDVLFEVGRAELKPGAFNDIRQVATFLKENPDRAVTIAGYTDSTGGEAFNLELSQARADAVRTALVQEGVQPSQVSARGFGESAPVASNETTAGRQLNRRVELTIAGSPSGGEATGAIPEQPATSP